MTSPRRWLRPVGADRRWWARRPRAGTAVAALGSLTGFLGLVLHYLTVTPTLLLGLVAVSPYLQIGSVVGLASFIRARARNGIAVAATILIWFLVLIEGPLYVASPAGTGRDLVVMTSNLRLGEAKPAALLTAVRRRHVDVLMTEELTPQAAVGLARAGLDRVLPFHLLDPRAQYAGTGMWSRLPLEREQRLTAFTNAAVTALTRVAGQEVRLVTVHLAGPVPVSTDWRRDVRRLRALLRTLAGQVPVILGGDFNATTDTGQYRSLIGGYGDAADQAGAGYLPTFPSDLWLPPVVCLDHIVLRHAVARILVSVEVPGSDHRALVATVRVTRRHRTTAATRPIAVSTHASTS